MIRSSEQTLEVWDRDFQKDLEYLREVLGPKTVHQILASGKKFLPQHYWYDMLKKAACWERDGRQISRLSGVEKLMQLAVDSKHIQVFEPDWRKNNGGMEFLSRLRKSDTAASVLFELTTGIHFLRQGFDVEYIGSESSSIKTADLRICHPISPVLVECTYRKESNARRLSDEDMAGDLLKSAHKKLQSGNDFGLPRLIAIRVPETLFWESGQLQAIIRDRISQWAAEDRMVSANALFFMGVSEPCFYPQKGIGSDGFWSMSEQGVLLVSNKTHCRYVLPSEVEEKLILRM